MCQRRAPLLTEPVLFTASAIWRNVGRCMLPLLASRVVAALPMLGSPGRETPKDQPLMDGAPASAGAEPSSPWLSICVQEWQYSAPRPVHCQEGPCLRGLHRPFSAERGGVRYGCGGCCSGL